MTICSMNAVCSGRVRPAPASLVVLLVALGAASTRPALGACNVIPSASQAFRGTLGATNRPFAAPGDFVEVGVQPARCDVASVGFGATAAEHMVTLVFTPPGTGQRRVVFLTSDPCSNQKGKQKACEAIPGVGVGNVTCVEGATAALAMVDRNGERRVSFRFPDTDPVLAPDGDDRTLAGPVTLAVTRSTDPLPCGLATGTCASATGLVACVDEIFAGDGTCRPNSHPVFSHFTALPPANDFQADCFRDAPPCTALAAETRLAVDAVGNLLLPVNWQGVLVNQGSVPVPRLLGATVKSPLPFATPEQVSLASYTPEGAKLPPIFEPQADPNVTDANVVSIFGSADAPYTVLRVARRAGRCAGGTHAGQRCTLDADCSGGMCPATCVGGTTPDVVCTADGECLGGGRCGALYADFRPLTASGGATILPRRGPGFCQLPPHQTCAGDGECAGVGDLCVLSALEATTPVALESLTAGTADLFAFTVNEAVDLVDRNGDGDTIDSVVTLRGRATGEAQRLGAPDGFAVGGASLVACGTTETPEGRAVVRISDPPFRFPALATEGDVIAFLESESAENYCDENGDYDRADAILRVFRLGGGEVAAGLTPPRVVEAEPRLNGQALVLSESRVFYLRPEAAAARQITERGSVGPGGLGAGGSLISGSYSPSISADGRFVAFYSDASNLLGPLGDTNGRPDVFVRDRVTGVTERISTQPIFGEPDDASAHPSISADGRFVAFQSDATNLVGFGGDTNGRTDVFVRNRQTHSTELVSTGPSSLQGNGFSQAAAISADGRFVAFTSRATNLLGVGVDTNGESDTFVHDRQSGVTERVSVGPGGLQGDSSSSSKPSISADGRFIAFESAATNLLGVGADTNGAVDMFVYDRQTGEMGRVSVGPGGLQADSDSGALGLSISADGRFVAFESEATNLLGVGGDTNGMRDVFVHDRRTGVTERVSVGPGGLQGDLNSDSPSISADGRLVAFNSFATNLLGNGVDTNGGGGGDIFVHDRQTGVTERVSVGPGGVEGDSFARYASISADGNAVAFQSRATNLLGTGGDTNGQDDIFVRGPDATDVSSDLFADGRLDDTVLEVLDVASGVATLLCPADQVSVAGGKATFLRPESPTGTAACPGGSLNPPDTDTSDLVVQCWPGTGGVQNLGRAASAVAMSPTLLAALVTESGSPVVQVHPVCAGSWTDVGQAADTVAFCGSIVTFLTPEETQGTFLNGDGDQTDRVLQLYNPGNGAVIDTGQAAEEFVCVDGLIAFRTSEAAQGNQDLEGGSGAPSSPAFVLQIWDTSRPECVAAGAPADCLHNSADAVTPCGLAACDPRRPYRVSGTTVKFLTFECDQRGGVTAGCAGGGTDLNEDGDAADLVVRVFDLPTGTTQTIGTVPQGSDTGGDPFQSGSVGGSDSGMVFVTSGRCIERLGGACVANGDCGAGNFCDEATCARDHSSCLTDADCPPGITCEARPVVAASPDTDGDGVPDHLDDCTTVPNADQTDTDGDGVGDACDLQTCGDGFAELDEPCDGIDGRSCPGLCRLDCTCVCTNTVPGAKLTVKTKRGAGQLSGKMLIDLAAYAGEPVVVRFSDTDSDPIVQQGVGALPSTGKSGKKWQFKTKALGLQQVQLKAMPKLGKMMLSVKAKEWFTATQANQPVPGDTLLTVTIGSRCFSSPATKKTD